MSTILIVEPNKLLQYAFLAALGADHDLIVVKSVPATAQRADLAIVDASALWEKESLSQADLESIRDWQVPVVWLDNDISEVPALDKLKRLKLPLDKAALQHALMEAQKSPETSVADAITRAVARRAKKNRVKTAKPNGASGESKQDIIELVDVVEELAGDGWQMESAKKE